MTLETLIRLAGVAQLVLAVASTTIPARLRWKEEMSKLRPLLRRLFWVYAGYILGFHVAFGLLSVVGAGWLLDGSTLATAVTGFIAAYWGARLLIQFLVFQRSGDVPEGSVFRLAEIALVALFVFLTLVYAAACAANLRR